MNAVSWHSAQENEYGSALIGSRIRIWWDGDMMFFEGNVVGYDDSTSLHKVVYYGEDTDVYDEDLEGGSQQWELARASSSPAADPATDTHADAHADAGTAPLKLDSGGGNAMDLELAAGEGVASAAGRKSTYMDMALEAVSALNEKNGVSLSSIRKWVQAKHPETKEKQKASFNGLTIKALMRLVSDGMLEKVKHSFRLSQSCVMDERNRIHDSAARKGVASAKKQAKEAKTTKRKYSGLGRRPVVWAGRKGDPVYEANKRMQRYLDTQTRKRNQFLSERRAALVPFMAEGDNFFSNMDRQFVEENLRKEQVRRQVAAAAAEAAAALKVEAVAKMRAAREAEEEKRRVAEQAKKERAEKELEGKRQALLSKGPGSPKSKPKPKKQPPPATPPPAPREIKTVEDIDFKAVRADPMTVAETLVKMAVLKREDIAPGAAKVALTGQRCTEWPPLQVDPQSGVPTMGDRDTMGARIEQQGPFNDHFITWPGTRVPTDDAKEISHLDIDLTYKHIYYLEKREHVASAPPPRPTLGPHGWVYPSQPPPPVPRIIGRTTALRLKSGTFVPHKIGFMKKTQAFAKRSNVPVDNLVTFSIINPHTRRRYNVTREFCAAPCYASIYKRLLRDTLRKDPSLLSILSQQGQAVARAAKQPKAAASPKTAAMAGVAGKGGEVLTPRPSPRPPNRDSGAARDTAFRVNGKIDASSLAASAAAAGEKAGTNGTSPRASFLSQVVPSPRGKMVSTAAAGDSFTPDRSPERNHYAFPRGPGGIDILSGPTMAPAGRELQMKPNGLSADASGEGRRNAERSNEAAAAAAAVAAAAMLGLGACAPSGDEENGIGSEDATGQPKSVGVRSPVVADVRLASQGFGGKGTAGSTTTVPRAPSKPPGFSTPKKAAASAREKTSSLGRCVTSNGHAAADISVKREAENASAPEANDRVGGVGSSKEGGPRGSPILALSPDRKEEHTRGVSPQVNGRAKDGDTPCEADRIQGNGVRFPPAAEDAEVEGALAGEGTDTKQPLPRKEAEVEVEVKACFDASDVPEALKGKLHAHQREGLRWMVHMYLKGMSVMLGDDMGLGKTLQTIALVVYLRDHLKVNGPYLMVVPFELIRHWMTEIDKFCPSLRVVRFHGSREERSRLKEEDLKDLAEFDVVVASYDAILAEGKFFRTKFLWQLVIVDEAHNLTNDKSQLSQKLMQVNAICRVLLTSASLSNHLGKIWALLHFLMPDVFGDDTAERFEEGVDPATGECDPQRMEQLKELLSIFMLQRSKAQVETDLPPKEEKTVLVKLSAAQQAVYKHLLINQDKKMVATVRAEAQRHDRAGGRRGEDGQSMSPGREGKNNEAKDSNDKDHRKLLDLLLQLRKACDHPYLLLDVEADVEETETQVVDRMIAASGKLSLLDRMLPRLQERGHRCLIFSKFTSMLDILEDYCGGRGYEYARIDEDTNPVQRRLEVRRFNAAASKDSVLLVSTRLGADLSWRGRGLNLASADTVFLYDSDWSHAVDTRAIETAYRIGQTKSVKIIRFVCRGSVEERMVHCAAESEETEELLNQECDEGPVVENPTKDPESVHRGQEEWTQALSVTGLRRPVSKGQVASLIHHGARAIMPQDIGNITDEELDTLLTRPMDRATDKRKAHSTSEGEAGGDEETEGVSSASNTVTGSSEPSSASLGSSPRSSSGSNGKSPIAVGVAKGRGEVVPDPRGLREADLRELDEMQEGDDIVAIKPPPGQCYNMSTCMLCYTGPDEDRPLVFCGYCPSSLHVECLEAAGIPFADTVTYECPQHRCAACARTTASAGGLLFRCHACPNAFCDECIDEDEVEALCRNRPLEALGYYDKRAYWIRCKACLKDGGRSSSKGKLADMQESNQASDRAGKADVAHGEVDAEDMEDEEDAPEDSEEDEQDDEPQEEEEEPVTFPVAMTMLKEHPAAEIALVQPTDGPSSPVLGKRPRLPGACTVETVDAKVTAGRYRSTGAFESDIRQLLTHGKGPRSISTEQKQMVAYFEGEILPRLRK